MMRKASAVACTGAYLVLINAMVYAAPAMYTPFLSAYYTRMDLTSAQIGVLLGVGPVMALLVQPLWGAMADRSGRRRDTLMLVTFGSAMMALMYYLGTSYTSLLLVHVLMSSFVTSLVPLSDSVMIEESRCANVPFATVRMGGTIGYAIVVYGMGRLLVSHPNALFVMASGGFLVMTAMLFALPSRRTEGREASRRTPLLAALKQVGNSEFIIMLLFALVCYIGLAFGLGFLGVYLTNLGYDSSVIGVANVISALSEVPVLLLLPRLRKRFTLHQVLAFSGVMTAIRVWLLGTGVLPVMYLAQALQGVTYMTVYYTCATYIAERMPSCMKSAGQSLLTMAQAGLGSIIGYMVGGRVVEALGLSAGFRAYGAFVLATSLALVFAGWMLRRRVSPDARGIAKKAGRLEP